MKLVYPDIDYVFDTENGKINTVVIENQHLFLAFVTDIQNQIMGLGGKFVLSSKEKIVPIAKNLELLDRFVPFDINGKTLITRIASDLEKKALSDEYYKKTAELVGRMDAFLTELAFDYNCDIQYSKIDIGSFIKAAGVGICDDYDSLGEKLIDYIQLIHEFIGQKLFVTVNLRSYLTDNEAELFMDTILSHGFQIIMVEGFVHSLLPNEKRLIIDNDLCLIN